MTGQHDLINWREGDDCPHCEAEEYEEAEEFYNNTDGGGNNDYTRFNYLCSECGNEWYVETEFNTWKVIK